MAVINYREELVDFERNGWSHKYIPTIKFFIHVWQRAECLQDVIDTFEEAFPSWSEYDCDDRLENWGSTMRARATRWRSKGVPLQHLRNKTPSHDKLAEFARCEAYKKQKSC